MSFDTALAASEAAFVAAATGRLDHLRDALLRFDSIATGNTQQRSVPETGRELAIVVTEVDSQALLAGNSGSTPQASAAESGPALSSPVPPNTTRVEHQSGAQRTPSTVSVNTLHPRRGWAPLHAAARYGQSSVVAQLVLWGADVNLRNSKDKSASTALLLASKHGHPEVVRCLLECRGMLPQDLVSAAAGAAMPRSRGQPTGPTGLSNSSSKSDAHEDAETDAAKHPPLFGRASSSVSVASDSAMHGRREIVLRSTASHAFRDSICAVRSVWNEVHAGGARESFHSGSKLDLELESEDNYGRTALVAAAEAAGADNPTPPHNPPQGPTTVGSAADGTFLTLREVEEAAGDTSVPHLLCLQLLLAGGCSVNGGTPLRGTALLRAACRGDAPMTRALLLCGGNPNASRPNPTRKWLFATSPVIGAVMAGSLEVLSHLVAAKGDLRVPVRRSAKPRDIAPKSLVDVAAAMGRAHVVEWLAQQGLSVNVSPLLLRQGLRAGPNWGTPLMRAARGGFAQTVELLLKLGADTAPRNGIGATALHSACVAGAADCAQMLCQSIAERHTADAERMKQIDAADVHGMTPLLAACAFGPGSAACIAALLAAGASCNAIDNSAGSTPLMAVIENSACSDEACFECVELLLHHGAAFDLARSSDRRTALHLACAAGRSQVAATLVALGSDLSARDIAGHTPSDASCNASLRLATMPLGYEIRFADIQPAVSNWLAVASAAPVTAPPVAPLAPMAWPQPAVAVPPRSDAGNVLVASTYVNSSGTLPATDGGSEKESRSIAAVQATSTSRSKNTTSDASSLPGVVPGLGGLSAVISAFGSKRGPAKVRQAHSRAELGGIVKAPQGLLPPLPSQVTGAEHGSGAGADDAVVWRSVQPPRCPTLWQVLSGLRRQHGGGWAQHVIHLSPQIVPADSVGAHVALRQAAPVPPALQWVPPENLTAALPPSGRRPQQHPPVPHAHSSAETTPSSARGNVASSRAAARSSEAEFEAALAGIRRYSAHRPIQRSSTSGAAGNKEDAVSLVQPTPAAGALPVPASLREAVNGGDIDAGTADEADGVQWDAEGGVIINNGEAQLGSTDDDDQFVVAASGLEPAPPSVPSGAPASSPPPPAVLAGGGDPLRQTAPTPVLPAWGTVLEPLRAAVLGPVAAAPPTTHAPPSSASGRAGSESAGGLHGHPVPASKLPHVTQKSSALLPDMYVDAEGGAPAPSVRFSTSTAQASVMYMDGLPTLHRGAPAEDAGPDVAAGPNAEDDESRCSVPLACIVGAGSHGIVWSGLWQGTPVAVKELTTSGAARNATGRQGGGVPMAPGDATMAGPGAACVPASVHSTLTTAAATGEEDDAAWRKNRLAVQSMQREIRMLRSIQSSPLVTSCYGLARSGDAVYAVLELAPGLSLRSLLSDKQLLGALSLAQRSSIARSLLHAVAHLHNQHIAHRDLHADNVMLTAVPTGPPHGVQFRVKIIDFGLALQMQGGSSDDISQAAARRTHRGLSKPTTGGVAHTSSRQRSRNRGQQGASSPKRRVSSAPRSSSPTSRAVAAGTDQPPAVLESKAGGHTSPQAAQRREQRPQTNHSTSSSFNISLKRSPEQPASVKGGDTSVSTDAPGHQLQRIRRGGKLAPSQLRLAEDNSTRCYTPGRGGHQLSLEADNAGRSPTGAQGTPAPAQTPASTTSAAQHFVFKNIDAPATPAAGAAAGTTTARRRGSLAESSTGQNGDDDTHRVSLDPWAAQRDMLGVAALLTWLLLGADAGDFSLPSWESQVQRLCVDSAAKGAAAGCGGGAPRTEAASTNHGIPGLSAALTPSRLSKAGASDGRGAAAAALSGSERGSFGDFLAPVWRVSCGVRPFPQSNTAGQLVNAGTVPRLNASGADAVRIVLLAADLSIPGAVAAGSRRATAAATPSGPSLRGATSTVMAAQELGLLAGLAGPMPGARIAAAAKTESDSSACFAPGPMQPSAHSAFRADACLRRIMQ